MRIKYQGRKIYGRKIYGRKITESQLLHYIQITTFFLCWPRPFLLNRRPAEHLPKT